MKVLICGYTGHMGQVLAKMISEDDSFKIVGGIVKSINKTSINTSIQNSDIPLFTNFDDINIDVDIIVDFSHHSITNDLLKFAKLRCIPVVIATTGQTEEEKNMIVEVSKNIPIFFAANFSIGIAVLIKEAKNIVKVLNNADIEIVETHHNRKLDSPSGTAHMIAEGLKEIKNDANLIYGRNGNKKREKNDIGINSIRIGNVIGIHEVMIATDHECITLKHEAYDRGLFAEGAINAMKFLYGKSAGLYNMNDLLSIK